MKLPDFIIELGDNGWAYLTDNEEAANAIESVVNRYSDKSFTTDDYAELSTEAKEIFDDFAYDKTIWIDPYGQLIWEKTLKKEAEEKWEGGWDEESLAYEGYEVWKK